MRIKGGWEDDFPMDMLGCQESNIDEWWDWHLISIPLNSFWIPKMTNHSFEFHFIFFLRAEDFSVPGWLGNSKNNILNRRHFRKVLGQRRSIIVVRCDLKIGVFWWRIFIPAFVMNFSFWKKHGPIEKRIEKIFFRKWKKIQSTSWYDLIVW